MRKLFKLLIACLVGSTMVACSFPCAIAAPTMTPTPPYSDWLTYTNQKYNFELKYPPDSQIAGQMESSAYIQLSIVPDTNLEEKYLDISVAENANPCSSPQTQGYEPGSFQSSQVTIDSLAFTLESGWEVGLGSKYEWTAYSTAKGSACASLTFVLHSSNPDMYATPPTLFDNNAESVVFTEIVSTFRWLTP
jgi:hypothetical protein